MITVRKLVVPDKVSVLVIILYMMIATWLYVSIPYAKLAVRWTLPDAPTILEDGGGYIILRFGPGTFCVGEVCRMFPSIFVDISSNPEVTR